uniref:Uncharacterized protein n=3 Tax=Gasterosteus aculeatus aculeatus TaxID=481459 RepID=A0AAQ4NTG9_GASAC
MEGGADASVPAEVGGGETPPGRVEVGADPLTPAASCGGKGRLNGEAEPPAPTPASPPAESAAGVALKMAAAVLRPLCLGDGPLMLPIHLQVAGAAAAGSQLGPMGAAPYLIASQSPVSLPLVLDQQVLQHMSPSVVPRPPAAPSSRAPSCGRTRSARPRRPRTRSRRDRRRTPTCSRSCRIRLSPPSWRTSSPPRRAPPTSRSLPSRPPTSPPWPPWCPPPRSWFPTPSSFPCPSPCPSHCPSPSPSRRPRTPKGTCPNPFALRVKAPRRRRAILLRHRAGVSRQTPVPRPLRARTRDRPWTCLSERGRSNRNRNTRVRSRRTCGTCRCRPPREEVPRTPRARLVSGASTASRAGLKTPGGARLAGVQPAPQGGVDSGSAETLEVVGARQAANVIVSVKTPSLPSSARRSRESQRSPPRTFPSSRDSGQ